MDSKQFLDKIRRRFSNSPIPLHAALLTARIVVHDLAEDLHSLRLARGERILDQTDFTALLREIEAEIEADEIRPRMMPPMCHRCGHQHAAGEECQVSMGGAGICGCREQVSA